MTSTTALPSRIERVGVGIGEAARIGEPLRRLLDPRLVPDVLLGRDDGHDHLFAERRLAEDFDLDARRGGVESAEVRLDLPVVGERLVGADVHPRGTATAKELLRRARRR